jgi:ligand-binding sensor domain-containing protein
MLSLPKVDGLGVDLAVATATGQVWLASQKSLYQVDRAGRLISTHGLNHPVQALAIDQDAAKLWLATNKSLTAYDLAGKEIGSARLNSRAAIKDLAFDPQSGLLWVAQANALQWLARDGQTRSFPVRGIAKLTVDGQGGAWAAGEKNLLRIDASGVPLLEVVAADALVEVAANPRDGSLWRLGTEWAAKYDVSG